MILSVCSIIKIFLCQSSRECCKSRTYPSHVLRNSWTISSPRSPISKFISASIIRFISILSSISSRICCELCHTEFMSVILFEMTVQTNRTTLMVNAMRSHHFQQDLSILWIIAEQSCRFQWFEKLFENLGGLAIFFLNDYSSVSIDPDSIMDCCFVSNLEHIDLLDCKTLKTISLILQFLSQTFENFHLVCNLEDLDFLA
jgi:hypothetical protein